MKRFNEYNIVRERILFTPQILDEASQASYIIFSAQVKKHFRPEVIGFYEIVDDELTLLKAPNDLTVLMVFVGIYQQLICEVPSTVISNHHLDYDIVKPDSVLQIHLRKNVDRAIHLCLVISGVWF